MPLTPEGKELLLKAKDQILLNPNLYDQDYISYEEPCGTVCCVAGWVDVLRFGVEKHNERAADHMVSVWDESAKALGLTDHDEANDLFLEAYSHPDREFSEEYENAKDGFERAQAAGRMIDRFIANHS